LKSSSSASAGETGSSISRTFFFSESSSSARGAKPGATIASTKLGRSSSAACSLTGVLKATTEPKALVGSVASALAYASAASAPIASPHGVVCLMIAHAATSASAHAETASSAPSRSSRLLKESSFPCYCRIAGSPPFAPASA
jgi:hypothetical protein